MVMSNPTDGTIFISPNDRIKIHRRVAFGTSLDMNIILPQILEESWDFCPGLSGMGLLQILRSTSFWPPEFWITLSTKCSMHSGGCSSCTRDRILSNHISCVRRRLSRLAHDLLLEQLCCSLGSGCMRLDLIDDLFWFRGSSPVTKSKN